MPSNFFAVGTNGFVFARKVTSETYRNYLLIKHRCRREQTMEDYWNQGSSSRLVHAVTYLIQEDYCVVPLQRVVKFPRSEYRIVSVPGLEQQPKLMYLNQQVPAHLRAGRKPPSSIETSLEMQVP
jgi:hypothetical protein